MKSCTLLHIYDALIGVMKIPLFIIFDQMFGFFNKIIPLIININNKYMS